MQTLIFLILGAVMLMGAVAQIAPSLSRIMVAVPDLISAALSLVVILNIALHKSLPIKPRYIVLAGLAFLHVLSGTLINSVDPGTLVIGLRPYLKWIPLFLLPAAINLPPDALRRQMIFILLLAMIQVPVSFYQRFFHFVGYETGDVVTGTLGANASGVLSIFLLSCIAVVTALYAKKLLKLKTFVVLFLMLFLPTTINETKVSFILLPIALIVPYLFAARKTITALRLTGIVVIGSFAAITAALIYSHMPGQGDVTYIASSRGASYLYTGKDFKLNDIEDLKNNPVGVVSTPAEAIGIQPRFDTLLLPFHVLSNDPIRLWSGLGIGNVIGSNIKIFSGEYSDLLSGVNNALLLSTLLWETGVGGVIIFFLFVFFVLQDAIHAARGNSIISCLASGWVAVTLMISFITIYNNILNFSSISFLFSYFSGYVAFMRYQEEKSLQNFSISQRFYTSRPDATN